MEETKKWYQSRAVWGSVVGAVALGLDLFGVHVHEAFEDDMVEMALKGVEIFGLGFAAWGRINASKKIA